MTHHNKFYIAVLIMLASPLIGFVIYLPMATTAYGSLDPLKGLFLGPIFIVPICLVYIFATRKKRRPPN